MYRVSTKISKEKFERMLSGNKAYLPKDVSKALRQAGKGKLLDKKSVHKDDALEAVEFLMKKGLLSSSKNAYKLYQKVGKEQSEEEKKKEEEEEEKEEEKIAKKEDVKEEKRTRRVRAGIAMDITEELIEEERRINPLGNRLRRKGGERVIDEIEEERQQRDKKSAEEGQKRKEFYNPQNPPQNSKKQASKPVDINKISDMDIG